MTAFRKLAFSLLFLVGLAVIGSMAPQTGSATASAPVAQPAPVNIAAVSVASVPVNGTVSVGNTPNVNVANLPAVQSVSFNGAQPVTVQKQSITLVCNGWTSNICTDLEQVAADGTLTSYTGPPSGSVLVVTDFTWKAASVTAGQVAFATLHHALTSPPHDVAFSAVVATPDNAAVSESHFSSGVLFSDVPIVFVSNTPNVAILQGYLATP